MEKTKRLENIPVMYISFFGDPGDSSNDAFVRLESKLPSLRGRKFYGVSFWDSDEYRACARVREEDHPEQLGFLTFTIPGGLYAYQKLKGQYEDIIAQIPGTFAELKKNHQADQSRPAVEFYRRHEEFIIYLPIVKTDSELGGQRII